MRDFITYKKSLEILDNIKISCSSKRVFIANSVGYILAKDIKMNINYSVSNLRIAGIGITLAYIITFLIMGI